MQQVYRVTKFNTPDKDETIVRSRDEAFALIAQLDGKLAGTLRKQDRATFLSARATLYEALGDVKMLEAAQTAFSYSKTANTAALVAVAMHHFGRLKEANMWYERAYRYPHEAGYEIDIGMEGALLSGGGAKEWLKAWNIVMQLKKRMVYAAMLPTWNGKPCKEVQIISEGGFGDLIHNCRYLPMLKDRGVEKITIFLPPFFFEHGFVDLAKRNSWWPDTKILTECKAGIPSAGFFDLPAIFETTPETIPNAPTWIGDSGPFLDYMDDNIKKIGFVGAAKAFETPLCPKGIYRSLTDEQAEKILTCTNKVKWTILQPELNSNITSWSDTADIIAGLDMVVTVDTAVAHLSASMNKPTHVLLSGAVDWKYRTEGTVCPWYPQMTLWRNNAFGFDNTVNNIIKAISEGTLF